MDSRAPKSPPTPRWDSRRHALPGSGSIHRLCPVIAGVLMCRVSIHDPLWIRIGWIALDTLSEDRIRLTRLHSTSRQSPIIPPDQVRQFPKPVESIGDSGRTAAGRVIGIGRMEARSKRCAAPESRCPDMPELAEIPRPTLYSGTLGNRISISPKSVLAGSDETEFRPESQP